MAVMFCLDLDLTTNQKKAVEHLGSPLLVEAGPGSGKTEVIIERVKFLTEHGGFDPSEILCITFTVKAAEEMRNRLEDDGIDTSQMTIMNYHAFYHEILEKNKSYTGLGKAKIISRATLMVWALENIDSFNFNDEIDITQNSISGEIEAIISANHEIKKKPTAILACFVSTRNS